ncbi:MAG: hypothetical protein ABSA26_04730 [Thermoguttaceae bacterium]|jgi:hypothetical protein
MKKPIRNSAFGQIRNGVLRGKLVMSRRRAADTEWIAEARRVPYSGGDRGGHFGDGNDNVKQQQLGDRQR